MQYRLNNAYYRMVSLIALALVCACLSFTVDAAAKHKRYLYVQPGQNIFSLVKVLYPDQQKQWSAIIKKIVNVNPHAFVAADANRIVVGQRLEIPVISSNTSRRKPVVVKKNVVKKAPVAVGSVIKKKGKVFVISSEAKSRDLGLGSKVFVGDRIYSGVKGFVRMSMIDEAKIDLRCNSEMLIEEYKLKQGDNRSVIHLIKGSVKKITGSIGKMAEDLYEMRTPLATVGVRGTEYAIRVLQAHGCDGSVDVNSKGLFVKVSRGFVDVKAPREQKAVAVGEVVYMPNENEKIKQIDAREGVFEAVPEEKKNHLGSMLWLIWILPVFIVLRKVPENAA